MARALVRALCLGAVGSVEPAEAHTEGSPWVTSTLSHAVVQAASVLASDSIPVGIAQTLTGCCVTHTVVTAVERALDQRAVASRESSIAHTLSIIADTVIEAFMWAHTERAVLSRE